MNMIAPMEQMQARKMTACFFFFFAPQRTRKTKINKEKKKKAIDQLEIAHSFKLRRLTGVGSDILFIFLGGQNDDLQSMTSSVEFENL